MNGGGAAGAAELDGDIQAAGRFLAEHGATATPVVQVGRTLFAGEERLGQAAAALRGATIVRTPAFR